MALKLKDITNLHSNLPISQIPQQQLVLSNTASTDQWSQQQQQHGGLPQQRRVSALASDDSGCDIMDDSLTDMQWLQRMDAGSDFPGLTHGPSRKRIGSKGTRSASKDGCRKKLDYTSKKGTNKPPLSYASLIALAICSTPQRMMTLSSIYRWIEYTFPFYRTPEAKAWKNSIRHNLSIRKNMFMKVYQYPPRRGNGSYWTLLSDGEEELKKAIPLFATLQPPVIDTNCAYHREPSTHTVKSKGKFIPVLPRSDISSSGLPYFSINKAASSSLKINVDPHYIVASDEIVVGETSSNIQHTMTIGGNKENLSRRPRHLRDHSYAKFWNLGEMEELTTSKMDAEIVELASGGGQEGALGWDESAATESDDSISNPSTPKRRQKLGGNQSSKSYPLSSTLDKSGSTSCVGLESECGTEESFTTPPKDQDNSLHLLDSSFLTPLKNLVPDVEIGAISFSPLYTNLVTPKQERDSKYSDQGTSSDSQSQSFLPSPFTPLKNALDSGIFSPLHSGSLGGMKFSTPTTMSPLGDLSSLQPELFSLKVLENSEVPGNTPLRPGSLQGLGLPGLTPPPSRT